MDNPIDRLQQSAAIARSANIQRRLKHQRIEERSSSHAASLGFDSEVGADLVQLPDGSIKVAAPMTSGARGTGDTLLLHQGQGFATIDALPAHQSIAKLQRSKQIKQVQAFKVLFSVFEGSIQKFYIGGDRKEPEFIFAVDTSIYDGHEFDVGKNSEYYTYVNGQYIYNGSYIHGFVSNQGTGKDDWIAEIRYSKEDNDRFEDADDVYHLSVITPNTNSENWQSSTLQGISYPDTVNVQTFTDYETAGVGLTVYRGAGLWISGLGEYPSELTKLLDLSYWYWEDEQYESINDLLEQANSQKPPPIIKAAMAENWDFEMEENAPPFLAAVDYAYDESDHKGIRSLGSQCNIVATEEFKYLPRNQDPPLPDRASRYLAPAGSYHEGEFLQFSSSWAHSILLGTVRPYSWDKYTVGEYAEYFKGGGINVASGFSAWNIGRFEAGHYLLDGVRKYVIINGIDVKKIDYVTKYSEGSFAGSRQKYMSFRSIPYFGWRRQPFINECSGRNYILPNKDVGFAKSKLTRDQLIISKDRQEVDPPDEYRLRASYAETVAASLGMESCLYYRTSIDKTGTGIWPKTIEKQFFIYDRTTDSHHLVTLPSGETDIKFQHRLDTFLKISDREYRRVYFDDIPEEYFEQENVKLTPSVQKYIKGVDGKISVESSQGKPVKVFSLKIDTTKKYHIHNLNFFQY